MVSSYVAPFSVLFHSAAASCAAASRRALGFELLLMEFALGLEALEQRRDLLHLLLFG